MTLRAPMGTKADLMDWLKGLQTKGCSRVIDVVDVATQSTAPAVSALIDPLNRNVVLAEGEAAQAGTREAVEALFDHE